MIGLPDKAHRDWTLASLLQSSALLALLQAIVLAHCDLLEKNENQMNRIAVGINPYINMFPLLRSAKPMYIRGIPTTPAMK